MKKLYLICGYNYNKVTIICVFYIARNFLFIRYYPQ